MSKLTYIFVPGLSGRGSSTRGFLKTMDDKIDYHEKTMLQGELSAGIFVNAASVIMRLGVATTILTGTSLILSGKIDFMLLFMFLLVITRVYAPFDQALIPRYVPAFLERGHEHISKIRMWIFNKVT